MKKITLLIFAFLSFVSLNANQSSLKLLYFETDFPINEEVSFISHEEVNELSRILEINYSVSHLNTTPYGFNFRSGSSIPVLLNLKLGEKGQPISWNSGEQFLGQAMNFSNISYGPHGLKLDIYMHHSFYDKYKKNQLTKLEKKAGFQPATSTDYNQTKVIPYGQALIIPNFMVNREKERKFFSSKMKETYRSYIVLPTQKEPLKFARHQ